MIGIMSYVAFSLRRESKLCCYFYQKQLIGDRVDRMIVHSSEIAG